MPIVPNGLPAWTRTASHEAYGGDVDKRNYQSVGTTDPLTDVSAEQFVRLAEDTAASTRTASFATLTIECDDTTPAAPTVEAVDMMTGVALASYAGNDPPTGFPSAARNGDGDVTVTFASNYTDAYGVEAGLTIRHASAGLHGSTAGAIVHEISGQTVRVRCFVLAGTAMANAKFTLEIAP